MAKQAKSKTSSDKAGIKIIVVNKKAKFNYHLEESFEAGIVLTGNEIKSIRAGHINLNEAYIKVNSGELFLMRAHVTEYSHSSARDYDPIRPRKLLMHKKQIMRLQGKVNEKGFTIVPTKIYLKAGRAKLEIALAKGKDAPDKRRTIQERQQKRQAERAIKRQTG